MRKVNWHMWFIGLKWAEAVIKSRPLDFEEAVLDIYMHGDYAYSNGEFTEFDRGAQDCVAHYRRLKDVVGNV